MRRAAFLLLVFFTSAFGVAQQVNQPDNPCAGSASTREISDCLVLAWEAQDGKLNSFYGEILPVLTADEAKALREAERIWIRYRDATCEAEKSLYGGGTGGQPAYLACMEVVTRNRLQELHRIYGWVLQKRRDEVQPKQAAPESKRVP